MSYQGLGLYYNIPTTSTSALFPDMVLTMNVPMDQMVADAVAIAYPNALWRAQQDVPGLVSAAWPGVMANVRQSSPALVDAMWPSIEAKLPAALEVTKKSILSSKELTQAVAVSVIATVALLGGAAALWVHYRR